MLLKECLRNISLPESEFDDDMTFSRSLFPSKHLVKKSLIEFKSCLYTSEECHPWLVHESGIYLHLAHIREIGSNKYLFWR